MEVRRGGGVPLRKIHQGQKKSKTTIEMEFKTNEKEVHGKKNVTCRKKEWRKKNRPMVLKIDSFKGLRTVEKSM